MQQPAACVGHPIWTSMLVEVGAATAHRLGSELLTCSFVGMLPFGACCLERDLEGNHDKVSSYAWKRSWKPDSSEKGQQEDMSLSTIE